MNMKFSVAALPCVRYRWGAVKWQWKWRDGTHFEWHQKLNALRLNKFIYISHTGATPAFCVAAPSAQTLGNWDPVKLETEY